MMRDVRRRKGLTLVGKVGYLSVISERGNLGGHPPSSSSNEFIHHAAQLRLEANEAGTSGCHGWLSGIDSIIDGGYTAT